jgi:hypothetical protein
MRRRLYCHSTLVEVRSLAKPEVLVEIETAAYLDTRQNSAWGQKPTWRRNLETSALHPAGTTDIASAVGHVG